jgi:hypothetical protein
VLAYSIILLEKVKLVYAAGWPDPFYYLGYAVDMRSLQIRDGATYTASRIPAIAIIKLQNALHLSNQNFRVAIIGYFLIMVFSILRLIPSVKTINALVVSLLVVNNIMLLRHISDDYALNFCLLFEFPLLYIVLRCMSDRKFEAKRGIAFGFLIACETLCNLSTLLLLVPLFVSLAAIIFIKRKAGSRILIRFSKYVFFGVIIGCLVAIIISYLLAGKASLKNFPAMLHAAVAIQGSQNTVWTQSLNAVSAYIILFALLAILSIGIFRGNGSRNQILFWKSAKAALDVDTSSKTNNLWHLDAFVLSALLSVVFGLLWHQVFGGAWLSYSFYAALYLPLVLVGISLTLQKVNLPISVALLIFEILFIREGSQSNLIKIFHSPTNLRVYTIFLLVIGLAIRITRKTANAGISLVVITVMMLSPLNETWTGFNLHTNQSLRGEYIDYISSWKSSFQGDVQNIAYDFARLVKSKIPPGKSLWVVYPNDASWLTSIASTQLYGYACFHCTDPKPAVKNLSDLSNLVLQIEEIGTRDFTYVISPTPLIASPNSLFKGSEGVSFESYTVLRSGQLVLNVYLYKALR